jgi:hypothetical protein
MSHVVHSGASEMQILTHYFSCLGGSAADLNKITPNMCFSIQWDL